MANGWSELGAALAGGGGAAQRAYDTGMLQGSRQAGLLEDARSKRDKNMGLEAITPQLLGSVASGRDPITGEAFAPEAADSLQGQLLNGLLHAGIDPRQFSGYQKDQQGIGFGNRAMEVATAPHPDLNLLNRINMVREGKPVDLSTINDGTLLSAMVTPDQQAAVGGNTPTDVGLASIMLKGAQADASRASAAKSRSEMGSSGNVVGGGKAADWSIQQGADGQLYRVNKLDGRALPVVAQGMPADGQPVVGANHFKATAADQKVVKNRAAVEAGNLELDRLAAAAQDVLDSGGLGGITGVSGVFPNMPGGAAANTQAKLDALKSQVGFSVLQNMRNNSPTGGALGQVSDRENEMLQNNLAALSRAQSEDEYRTQLQKIIDFANSSKRQRMAVLEDTYPGGQGSLQSVMGGGTQGAAPSASGSYHVGQIIMHGGKAYRVTGGDPNDPDVEPVQ